jgi:hypothetical protein
VVEVIEAAEKSLRQGGGHVAIERVSRQKHVLPAQPVTAVAEAELLVPV